MKARVSDQGAFWEVECPECGETQSLPDGESVWDCAATANCPGQLTEPTEDAEDFDEGHEVEY